MLPDDDVLFSQANEQLGMPMTYTLFESVKDFAYDGDMFQNSFVSVSRSCSPDSFVSTGVQCERCPTIGHCPSKRSDDRDQERTVDQISKAPAMESPDRRRGRAATAWP